MVSHRKSFSPLCLVESNDATLQVIQFCVIGWVRYTWRHVHVEGRVHWYRTASPLLYHVWYTVYWYHTESPWVMCGRQASHGYHTSPSVPCGWQIAMASHKKSFSSVLLVENHGIAHKVLQFSCVGRVQCYWYETIIQRPSVLYSRQGCKGITEQVLQFCVAGRVPKLPHFKAKCSPSH